MKKISCVLIVAAFLVASLSSVTAFSDDIHFRYSPIMLGGDIGGEIEISTAEELSLVGSERTVNGKYYPLDGAYIQTKDIDFTGTDLNGGFDVIVKASYADGALTVTLYYGDDTTKITSSDLVTISANGTIHSIPSGSSSTTFALSGLDPTESLYITAGGKSNNIPDGMDTSDPYFAVSVVLVLTEGDASSECTNSNGNMDPIGTKAPAETYFTGTYDGKGFKITGLKTAVYSDSTIRSRSTGLFGTVGSSTILGNICLEENSSISLSHYPTYAGGLIGHIYGEAIVINCYATGNVSATVNGSFPVSSGGLIGHVDGDVLLFNCYTTGNVLSIINVEDPAAGGLIGSVLGKAWVLSCHATGNVLASSSSFSTPTASRSGGLIGYAVTAIIDSCYAASNVSTASLSTSSVNTYAYSGGLVGHAGEASITNSITTGNVSATAHGRTYSGGLVGHAGEATVIDCLVAGNVSASSSSSRTNTSEAYANAGGLIGHVNEEALIVNCITAGNVSASASSYSSSSSTSYSSTAGAWSGGIIGTARGEAVVLNCHAAGNVSASSSSGRPSNTLSATSTAYSGGLIGLVYGFGYATFMNCCTTGDVASISTSTSYSSTAVALSGGLIGSVDGAMLSINCYIIGVIAADGGSKREAGVMAWGASTMPKLIINCYFLKETGTNEDMDLYSGGVGPIIIDGTLAPREDRPSGGYSSAELRTQGIYYDEGTLIEDLSIAGWDFNDTWYIDEHSDTNADDRLNQGYPILRGPYDIPVITDPEDITSKYLEGNIFSVSSSAVATSYQWQRSTDDGASWSDIEGANQREYTTTNDDVFGGQYRCMFYFGSPDPLIMRSGPAVLMKAPFDVSVDVTGNGTVQYNGGNISSGTVLPAEGTMVFTVLPSSGHYATITLDGDDVTSQTASGEYTLSVTGDHTLSVVFELTPSTDPDKKDDGLIIIMTVTGVAIGGAAGAGAWLIKRRKI